LIGRYPRSDEATKHSLSKNKDRKTEATPTLRAHRSLDSKAIFWNVVRNKLRPGTFRTFLIHAFVQLSRPSLASLLEERWKNLIDELQQPQQPGEVAAYQVSGFNCND